MDMVAFVLNTVIGVVLVGGTIGFLMQSEPATSSVYTGIDDEAAPSESPSVSPGPCPQKDEGRDCAGPAQGP